MVVNYQIVKNEYKSLLEDVLNTNSIELLEQKHKAFSKISVDVKSALDQAFRDFGLELLGNDCDISVLKNLISLSILTCRHEMSTTTIPVMLLADIFDALTLEVCEDMFTFVEEQVNVWKEPLFFTSCKNNLLRMCNDLLRRLSRASATVFCGRILLFLAKFFPFSERSGLNIVSEFNLENVTEYGGTETNATTKVEVAGSKKNIEIDYSLYCKFWSLQDFFRNPNQCYTKVQWKLFCSHATSILSTFHGLKLDYVNKMGEDDENEDSPYFSKYLTNQKLLDLQIYDVNFRRYVLMQFLILFQYLTSTVKFKSNNYELNQDQEEWVQSAAEKVYNLLRETPPDGEKFAVIIKNILQREEHWNMWKNSGCPAFADSIIADTNSGGVTKLNTERPLLGDLLKEANANGKYYLGSSELTKLWNFCPNNLDACKAKDRDFLPSLESYFAEAISQIENTTLTKPEAQLLKDGNFGWRALRLLARRSPHFFTYGNNPINQLPNYLDMMVRKIASERPGIVPKVLEKEEPEEQEDALFKEEPANEDIKQEEDFADDQNPHTENIKLSVPLLLEICEKVAPEWPRLAAKLGFKPDEIQFFERENATPALRAQNAITLWYEDEIDPDVDTLLYILEGLDMYDAVACIKAEKSRYGIM